MNDPDSTPQIMEALETAQIVARGDDTYFRQLVLNIVNHYKETCIRGN